MFTLAPHNASLSAIAGLLENTGRAFWVTVFNASGPPAAPHIAYWEFWRALKQAPARGVDCRLLLPQRPDTSTSNTRQDAALAELAAAGWNIRHPPPGRLLHSKMWISDARAAVVTSANLSQSALTLNHEITLSTTDTADTRELMARFVHLWTASK